MTSRRRCAPARSRCGAKTRTGQVRTRPNTSGSAFSTRTRWGGAKLPDIAAEGFALRHHKFDGHEELSIIARDAGGAMYGGLELAEQIRARGVEGVTDTDRNPYLRMRGTKFNIPLDLRNPSYSDMSDSAQQNIATVWDFEFWRAYLDALARDRYNYVSLWNLHPFPSMVKVPEYPDVALNDVWRSKIKFDEDYSTRTDGHRHARDARRQGSRQTTHHRAEDRFLAPRDAIREGPQHRVLRDDVEHLHLRRRWQVRHHRRDRQPEDRRLLPRQRARDVPHLSTAARHRPHRRREHGRCECVLFGRHGLVRRQGKLAARHLRPGRARCSARRAAAAVPAHPPPARVARAGHRDHIQTGHRATQRGFRLQLQVRAGARVVVHHADLPSRLSRVARRPARRSGRCATTTR